MSQIYVPTTSSSMPTVPTSFPTDSGTAIPVANVLNVVGGTTPLDNPNGIITLGIANTIFIDLTNRFEATVTIPAGTKVAVLTIPLGPGPASYRFSFDCIARDNATNPITCGYSLDSTFKVSGGITPAATKIKSVYIDGDEQITSNKIQMDAVGTTAVLSYTNGTANVWTFKFVGSYVIL